ncbi:MAG TPA: class I lanthipeptide [Chitinophaga sp.]|uniref:class I lanthipeptide n=1 Tax=Chitinophaga sp. TaxID=1869181 RepID=UPI002CA47CAD|nr:class I lanthipeptide [Chitinophaga sp.]HVI47412.1 class I lanthipeptide [Chitinophaga sp.]
MKEKKFSKKLLLDKKIIVNLNHDEMRFVNGGVDVKDTIQANGPCMGSGQCPTVQVRCNMGTLYEGCSQNNVCTTPAVCGYSVHPL